MSTFLFKVISLWGYNYFKYLPLANTFLELSFLNVYSIFDFDIDYFQMLALFPKHSTATSGHIPNKYI